MADIAKINGLNLKDAAARADIATAKTDIAGLKESVIKEISSSYIRITDYPTGVYKLTYNGTKYIYYYGATNTSTVDVKGSSGAVILTVNRYSTSRWSWSYINTDVNGVMYLGYGQTNTSSGTRNVMTLPSDVTGTLATTALATTSISGLMSSADKTKLDALDNIKNLHEAREAEGTFTGLSGTVYFNLVADKDNYNGITKIKGTLRVASASSSDTYKYRLINLYNIRTALGTTLYSHIINSNFIDGWWWGDMNDGAAIDMYGYGTKIKRNSAGGDYFELGRCYTTSFSYGGWAQDTFRDNMRNGVALFEMWFKNS